jgi:two-component system response regulator (stage 0 sporulation protein F)
MAKAKILTIDDEAEFTGMIEEYFKARGYDVFVASRGVRGIELIKQEKPDIVLIDLKMPGIDGDQVVTQLKTIHPKAKSIIITAFIDEGRTKKRLEEAGVYAYFEKPLSSLKDLESAIEGALKEA